MQLKDQFEKEIKERSAWKPIFPDLSHTTPEERRVMVEFIDNRIKSLRIAQVFIICSVALIIIIPILAYIYKHYFL